MNLPGRVATRPAGAGATCWARQTSGLGKRSAKWSATIAGAPPTSSAGWNTATTVPRQACRFSAGGAVAPRRQVTCTSWPQACVTGTSRRGFHGSSIEVICERAGLTRGAFYSNYRTKEGLFLALFELHAERVIDRPTRALDELDTVDDPLRAALTRMNTVDETEHRWYLLSTEFTLHAIRHPDTARILADHDRSLREETTRLFDRLGRTPSVDLDLLARLRGGVRQADGDVAVPRVECVPGAGLEPARPQSGQRLLRSRCLTSSTIRARMGDVSTRPGFGRDQPGPYRSRGQRRLLTLYSAMR